MPHAPLLVPEVGGTRGAAVAAAVKSLDLSGAGAIVLASPHGFATGIYRTPAGDLDAFGRRGVTAAAERTGDLAHSLSEAWGRPLLDGGADHGVVVPLRLLSPSAPVVAVTFEEGSGADEGVALAKAVSKLGGDIAFVASANLSAGLTDRSPLPSLEGAADADAAVVAALRDDPAGLVEQAESLTSAGSCAAPTLAAFGTLFAARPCGVLAYEHPFGVGYVVATTAAPM